MDQNTCIHILRRGCAAFVLLIQLSMACAAQDSLRPGTDTARINQLIANAGRQADPDSALILYNEPLEIALKGNYFKAVSRVYKAMGQIYYKKGDYEQCIALGKKDLEVSKLPFEKAKIYYNLGLMHSRREESVEASENYFAALGMLQGTDKATELFRIRIYSGLSAVYLALKQGDKGGFYLGLAENLARKENSDADIVRILLDKCNFCAELKKTDSANIFLNEAIEICKRNNFKDKEGPLYFQLGNAYLDSGKYDKRLYGKALDYFKKGYDLAKGASDERSVSIFIISSSGMGLALLNMGRYNDARDMLIPAVEKAKAYNYLQDVIQADLVLADVYKAMGQYEKALDTKDSILAMKDSLAISDKANAINKMEVKYKLAEKDRLIMQSQLLIARQNNKIARKNTWITGIAAGVIVLLIIGAGAYLQMLNRQKSIEKESKIAVLKAAIQGEDNERSRVARELHDGIGGMLSAAMMRFSSMHHDNPTITSTEAYKDAMRILREMGDEIRKTAHNLMPEVLIRQSLAEAVRVYCSNVQEGNDLKIDFQCFGSFENLSQSYKLNIFRIIQELIKNVSSHARASHVLVQLMQNENKLIVSVEDNGIGFNVNETGGGLGLNNIRSRAATLDGQFTLESEPGRGTTVIIEFEIVEAQAHQPLFNREPVI